MRAVRLTIENFRGVKQATIILPKHGVLIGDNNTGKTTILEALDLALGPDRLNRRPPIDEHDFFRGLYTFSSDVAAGEDEDDVADDQGTHPLTVEAESKEEAPKIEIEVTVADLNEEQKGTFADYIEFWDSVTNTLYDSPNPTGVDADNITESLRITFHGWYDVEEDDFEGKSYFTRSLTESDRPDLFSRRHKQVCGFLYLRTHRTGTRALSLERGSLLDIILRLKEVRPQMWEATLGTLSDMPVASDPGLGVSPVLESINTALKKYVPKEWGVEPHLKVSNLTREHLRKVITAFIATGEGEHAAPFYRQGTGTINMLVLAMLSQIAEDKQNVIFAMEEPETAIPPYAQKRIVHEIRDLASQTLFTSHSPYVLEEFSIEETMVLARDADGILTRKTISLPDNVKLKRYRQEFRTRFCEGLLARRVLIAEGATETSAFPVACRRLAELRPDTYSSLEALGVCVVDADGESNIPGVAQLYREIGKNTFAVCDKQEAGNMSLIQDQVELLLMHGEKGFEDMVLKGASDAALKRFANQIDWPQHLAQKYPDLEERAEEALADYFARSKANWGIADFLAQCSEDEIPDWLKSACQKISHYCTLDIESFRLLWGDPVADDEDDAPAGPGSNPEDGTDGSD
ncbi:MAG: AAA family ATPase [Flavobacteriales bacterium]|uniref:ATP-dependent nuclease n=1 Tax=Chromohalobacter israelensis TaxID=141390 RepID=UPI003D7C1400|nr:AAA family ATPase [Flavobacteriales bacterium]